MSLNGLDDVKLKEAHEAAAAEPGGWFLLKYASRDEVELLGKGTGGIVEIRNAVASYEEPSPLFGYLRYRRRNVLIKYIPEDCSRLVQARVAVHFNAITERFSPYDTDFHIATAKELRDTTLSAACSLHTASGSTSSSTSSLRRRRLMEIAEDEEEDIRKRQSTVLEERPGVDKTGSVVGTSIAASIDAGLIPLKLAGATSFPPTSDLDTSPPPPREPQVFDSGLRSPTISIDEPQSRKSSQSVRPELFTNNTYSTGGRPKVKLGPRPSLEATSGRPHSSGTASLYRPVSTLPLGLKVFGKGSRQRPQSTYDSEQKNLVISPPPVPDNMPQAYTTSTPVRPHTSGGQPPSSSNTPMKPLALPITVKTPTITPEKARLLKALEMRKRQKTASVLPALSPNLPDTLVVPTNETRSASDAPQEVQDTVSMLNDMANEGDTSITFDVSSAMKTDESDATRSDSYPVSPVGPSEQAESTRASSISESTDETVQESVIAKNVSDEEKSSASRAANVHQLPAYDIAKENAPETRLPEVDSAPEINAAVTPIQETKSEELPAKSHAAPTSEEEKEKIFVTSCQPEVSSHVSNAEVMLAPEEDLNTKMPQPQIASKETPFVAKPNGTEKLIIEPVKMGKTVTFDESEDHVIEDTLIGTDDHTDSEMALSGEELTPVKDTVPAEEIAMAGGPVIVEKPAVLEVSSETPGAVEETAVPENSKGTPTVGPVIGAETVTTILPPVVSTVEESRIVEPSVLMELTATADLKVDAPSEKPFEQEITKADQSESQKLVSSAITESIPATASQPTLTLPPKSPAGSIHSVNSRKSMSGDEREDNERPSTKRKKRRGLVEPIRTDLHPSDQSGANTDANLSSDDEFMDELHSAVLQEAKPISVTKSPITPMFPSPKKADSWRAKFSRTSSNPTKKTESESLLLTPNQTEPPPSAPLRSVSAGAAYLNRINQESNKPVTKKVNVGSGIAARMKAFEKFAGGNSTPPQSTGPTPGSTPAFFSVKKSSVRVASRSPGSIAERANSINKNTPSPPSTSYNTSPDKARQRDGSAKNNVSTYQPIPILQAAARARPESVSVTAKIIRDPSQPFQNVNKDPSEYAPLDLKQSPLVIDHQRAIPVRETIEERRLSKEQRLSSSSDAIDPVKRRSSVTIVKDLINERRASFTDRRRSINLEPKSPSHAPSLKSPSRPPSTHAATNTKSHSISSRLSSSSNRDMPDVSMASSQSGDASSSEDKGGKKSNRASRMLRRMSSSLSSSRKALAHAVSPTVREEPEAMMGKDAGPLPSPRSEYFTPNINIGDVNVQFPDSLLWKRRSMMLDSQGFLILSPALTASGKGKTAGGATRRFHLSDFRFPVIPDMEMEELPNSVLLDFFEGGGLQIACEDRAGQGRVLEVLQDAHRTAGNQ